MLFESLDIKRGLENIQAHDHACVIYETEEEWRKTVIPFIILGIKRGEKCIYACNNRNAERIRNCLKTAGVDVISCEKSGQLWIVDKTILPGDTGKLNADGVFAFFLEYAKKILAEGYRVIRVTIETLYNMVGFNNPTEMVELNARLNREFFPIYPCVVMAQYNRLQADPELLRYALITHSVLINASYIYSNPLSIADNRDFRKKDTGWETDYWLKKVKSDSENSERLQFLAETFERFTQPMLAVYPDASIMAFNEALCKLIGYSRRETTLVEKKSHYFQNLLHFIIESFEAQGEEEAVYFYEQELKCRDGKMIPVEMSVNRSHDREYYYIFINDVSKRKRAEEALRKSEEKYRLIAENVADMVDIIDLDTYCYLYNSPSNLKELGRSETELAGKSCLDNIHRDDRKNILQKLNEGKKMARGSIQFRIKKKDGSYIWLESVGKLIDFGGKAAGLLVSRDISARKIAEEKLKKELEYHSTLIETMNELLYTYDRDYRLTFANQKACEITGYSFAEGLGRSIFDLIPADHIEKVRQEAQKRLWKGETGNYEHKILCKDGSELLVKAKTSPLIENGEIIGGLVVAEDITKQRKIEKEMVRLEELNTIGEIAAGMGHEIRNPMTTVKGFLQMMSQNEDFFSYNQEFAIMLEELERANSIISEFLSLAKNKLIDLQLNNLNAILENLFPLLQANAAVADKSIVLELEEIPDLWVDKKEICQLIINLIRNSLEAMSSGGTVTIKTCREKDTVLLTVKDQGKGIAAEVLDKVGRPFFTTKDNGTGLGLAVCYGIIARHNASMEIQSNNYGTTCSIIFPIPAQE